MTLGRIKTLAVVLCLGMIPLPTRATGMMAQDPVLGYWLTDARDGVIEFYVCNDMTDTICGRFHWLKSDAPQNVSRDVENPNPARRQRPLCGLQFMGGFKPTSNGRYEDGWIYSPQSGATYQAQMTLLNDRTLDLHGYVLTPLLGESRTWTRTTARPVCVTDKL